MVEDTKWTEQCELQCLRLGKKFRIKSDMSCRNEVIIPLYKANFRSHLGYRVQAWAPFLKKDAVWMNKVQLLTTCTFRGNVVGYAERPPALENSPCKRD